MSPRPRTVQDAAILDAAIEVLGRIGSEKMTLADVGAEVGLSAATLVQRFGPPLAGPCFCWHQRGLERKIRHWFGWRSPVTGISPCERVPRPRGT